MNSNEYFDTIFESNLQPKVQKIKGGTMWSETTLVISTDAKNDLTEEQNIGTFHFSKHRNLCY